MYLQVDGAALEAAALGEVAGIHGDAALIQLDPPAALCTHVQKSVLRI